MRKSQESLSFDNYTEELVRGVDAPQEPILSSLGIPGAPRHPLKTWPHQIFFGEFMQEDPGLYITA